MFLPELRCDTIRCGSTRKTQAGQAAARHDPRTLTKAGAEAAKLLAPKGKGCGVGAAMHTGRNVYS